MHNGHFWHLSETRCRKYSLFGKVGHRWKRLSAITCRNKRESELYFRKILARSGAFGIKVQVRPV